ncbi:MAG: substrate-binding domain-containing protein [Roseburia sp.]|nr:substrate-binding domain-containing protein [Roseburia sp.]MCM1242081.1 substrate-binding domain-containing protein [Roseburia sp.]
MKKRVKMLSCVLAGSMLVGCGGGTTPEIIMPDEPMTSSVGVQEQTATSEASPETEAPAAQESAAAQTSGENYTVYLITMDLTDSYWQSIDEGCRKAVDELGNITYQWIGPDAHDDALQSACIDEAVTDGADAILIAANSADGVNASLQKAEETGCKIVYVDSAASYDCVTALATDNEAAGATAAETMKEALAAQGIESGTIGIMGVTADTVSCVARENGFRAAFEGTDFVLTDTVFMQDDAGNITNAVNEGIAGGYVGFFGTNEGTTVAIGEARKEAGADVTVIGFDTSDAVLSLVAEDFIQATMQQNPQTMGYEGLKIAVGALDGSYTDINTKTDTGVTVITRESM